MTTALLFVGMLLGAGYWCYRQGKGSEALGNYKSDLAKSKRINEADNEHDVETNSLFDELKTGIGRVYAEPATPECVGELGDHGLYDYRQCDLDSIGRAWVLEKRTRLKYQNQITVINE